MNFSLLNPPAPEENCATLEPFLVSGEEAEVTEYVSSTPPLLSHTTGKPLDIKTARKPLVLQPTTIRLNKVRPPLPLLSKLKYQHLPGIEEFRQSQDGENCPGFWLLGSCLQCGSVKYLETGDF